MASEERIDVDRAHIHMQLVGYPSGVVTEDDLSRIVAITEGQVKAESSRPYPCTIAVEYTGPQMMALLAIWVPGSGWMVPDHLGRYSSPSMDGLKAILKDRLAHLGINIDYRPA